MVCAVFYQLVAMATTCGSDIKRHTMCKDNCVYIEIYGVAHGFPVRDLGEEPVRAPSIAEWLYHTIISPVFSWQVTYIRMFMIITFCILVCICTFCVCVFVTSSKAVQIPIQYRYR